jgi:hypothetical protein
MYTFEQLVKGFVENGGMDNENNAFYELLVDYVEGFTGVEHQALIEYINRQAPFDY